ncbi:MAG: C_GCAxxG_C_C family protein [Myxococcales bacterium]|nr:C_GCAxxG_C_C family protein [Myxococcales bacterium]
MPNDTKKIFHRCGTCSRTFHFLLNREFGHPADAEERAADPLAGGLMRTGHQCGMLWGASLAVGAEASRRYRDPDQAAAVAIATTRGLMESFAGSAKSVDCREITGCDLTSKSGLAKLLLKTVLGLFYYSPCFNLAEKWTPEAFRTAKEGLTLVPTESPQPPLSCASLLAKKMGAGDAEAAMVAGFAGGLGLSGNACGALGAAIWLRALAACRNDTGKPSADRNQGEVQQILRDFDQATAGEILCAKISGRRFATIDEHGEFIRNGGCGTLIDLLAHS